MIIGTALLPTLNKFLSALGEWLDKMNRSGQLQKDVNEAVKTATGIFQGVLAVVKPLATAFQDLGKVLGGTKNEVKDLAIVFAAFKFSNWISQMGLLGTSIKGIGTEAETAKASTTRLNAALGALGAIGVITVTIQEEIVRKQARQALADQGGSPVLALDPGAAVGKRQTRNGVPGTFQMVSGQLWWVPDKQKTLKQLLAPFQKGLSGISGAVGDISRLGIPNLQIPGGAYGNTAAPLSTSQQRAIGLAAQPQNLGLLRQQAQHDQAALDFAKKLRSSGRISNAKYVEEVTHYASDLQQTNSTIAGILQAARQKVADAAKAAAEKQKQAAQALKERLQAAREHTVAVAQLAVTRAQATPGYQDDLATERHLVEILKSQLAADRQNVDLQNQLFDAEQAVKATVKQRADAVGQAKIAAGQLAVQRAGLTDSSSDDLATNQRLLGILKATHASETDIVAQQLVIKGVRDQIKQQNQQDAQEAKQRAKDAATAAAARKDAIQFRLLGLGPTGGALVPGVANLKTRFAGIKEAVKGTFLDTPKTGSELDHIQKILSGQVREGQRGRPVGDRPDVQGHPRQAEELEPAAQGAAGVGAELRRLVGLEPHGCAEARDRVAVRVPRAGRHRPAGRSLAFAAPARSAIVINGGVHLHGVQDVPGFENELREAREGARRTCGEGRARWPSRPDGSRSRSTTPRWSGCRTGRGSTTRTRPGPGRVVHDRPRPPVRARPHRHRPGDRADHRPARRPRPDEHVRAVLQRRSGRCCRPRSPLGPRRGERGGHGSAGSSRTATTCSTRPRSSTGLRSAWSICSRCWRRSRCSRTGTGATTPPSSRPTRPARSCTRTRRCRT